MSAAKTTDGTRVAALPFNATDARILKIWRKGVAPASIARKIGRPGDLDRVRDAVERAGLPWPSGHEAGR